jgi:hypothetical protein
VSAMTQISIFSLQSLGIFCLIILSGCSNAITPGRQIEPTFAKRSLPTNWADQWWLEKTSRALRGGIATSAEDNRELLLSESRTQVVDQFLADPRFADTILDFSLLYIGFKQDLIKTSSYGYLPPVYQYPQALLASREVAAGGDFLKIFQLQQQIYMSPLKRPKSSSLSDSALSDSQLREKIFQSMQTDLTQLIQTAANRPDAIDDLCTGYKAYLLNYVDVDPLQVTNTIPYDLFYSVDFYGGPNQYCDSRVGSYDFASKLISLRSKNEIFFNLLRPLDSSLYHPQSVSEIRTFDFAQVAPAFAYTSFTPQVIARSLQNSSTNYDRKRASYILKRFLCDDMTPINVENPAVHAGDIHGTNPSCFACHYKLDPMAGFFRFHGGAFTSFSGRDSISFDDNATVPLADYLKAWDGTDSAHPLNVGYIRSTQDPSQNYYGSSLEDLLGFLRTAPEARRCLMKRAFEYLVSNEQTIDRDYLDYLAEQFERVNAAQGSVAALKNSFKTIVLGRAFSTQNANRDTCYDLRPGAAPSNGVPCKVASILQQNCVQCHSSTSRAGHLDLSHWQGSGANAGFPHLRGGIQAPNTVTFQTMLNRISSTDPDERMPYLSDMPSQDRQQLYSWLNGLLTGGSP